MDEYEYTGEYVLWYLSYYKLNIVKCPYGKITDQTLEWLKNYKHIELVEQDVKYDGKIYEYK